MQVSQSRLLQAKITNDHHRPGKGMGNRTYNLLSQSLAAQQLSHKNTTIFLRIMSTP